MSEMIERVAQAQAEAILAAGHFSRLRDGTATRDSTQAAWHAVARAAIEAMREPTEAMRQEAFWAEGVEGVWHSMIEAALK